MFDRAKLSIVGVEAILVLELVMAQPFTRSAPVVQRCVARRTSSVPYTA
jgi:hypothetical protein